jgi:predicted permease
MAGWLQDLKYTIRRLAKSPGLAVAAVASIGLGIAANATVFSMVSRFVLKPAPVGDPATLLEVHTTDKGECCNAFSWPTFVDLRDTTKSFSGITGYHELVPASIGGNGEPERVWGQATTTNFFQVAQLGMTLGRGFRAEEEHAQVIVLGARLWKRRFGGDPAIAGKSVMLSGRPYTIIGVAPTEFRGLDLILDCEYWVPLANIDQLLPKTSNYDSREYHWIRAVGRLRPGVTRPEAAAELNGIAQRLGVAHPATDKDGGFRFEQAGSLPPRDRNVVLGFLAALSVVVLLVLCIASANVANLLLAQASERNKEMAVRAALGATRGQLLRQMLTESVLLALGGGVFGVAVSLWATQGLSAFRFPAPVPLDLRVIVDWRVLAYSFLLSVVAGVLFGLASAWVASRPVLSSALKGEDLLGRPGSRWSLRNVLAVAQIAMSLILLCATGLFLRSLQNAARMDVGFRSRGVLMMSVDPRLNGYSAEKTVRFLNDVRERVAALPGAASVAITDTVPLSGGNRSDGLHAEGRTGGPEPSVELYMASAGYFETIGAQLIAGRDFGVESAMGPKVAVVSESLVEKLFPNENPIGQRVSGGDVTYEIIGVVKNMKSRTLGEQTRPVLFRSVEQTVSYDPALAGYTVMVRYAGGAAGLSNAVGNEIRTLDPTLAIYGVQTMQDHLREALFLPRLAGTLFSVFGSVGLVLAAIGLYGVMSYSVSRRTHEIGIRMALGAEASGVQRLIVGQGMRLTLVALLIGLPTALGVAKLATSFLYGVQARDVVTFTIVPIFLIGVTLLACWIPSRRAASVDPLEALRYE